MLLFFDTETTGLPRDLPTTHPNYPKVVQIAWVWMTWELDVVSTQQLLVDPGVEIPVAASNIHGITTEKVLAMGTNSKLAIKCFLLAAVKASVVIGHNVKYDDGIIDHESHRHGLLDTSTYQDWRKTRRICTNSRRLLKLPKKDGPRASDMIKLVEAHEALIGTPFEAHNALNDTLACVEIFKSAVRRGGINLEWIRKELDEAEANEDY